MKCWYCGSTLSKVVDKREVYSLGEVRRRRECLKCHKRFTTYEKPARMDLMVLKRDGRKELFSRDKLKNGLAKALEKRPGIDQLDDLVAKLEGKLRDRKEKPLSSKLIGQSVLVELKRIDQVAYLRFASVYRGFSSMSDFTKEVQSLDKNIKHETI